MAIDQSNLKPYVSLTLMTDQADPARTPQVALSAAEAIIQGLIKDEIPGSRSALPASITAAAPDLRGFTYQRAVQASWTTDLLKDVQNHLVLVMAAHGYIAVHISDPKLQSRVTSELMSDRVARALKDFAPVSRARLEDAFVADGPTKTLWLSGVHPRNALKANSKVLSGDDLIYALDVFDDQTFWWSAARSRHPGLGAVVGSSAKASRIWLRKADDLADYVNLARNALQVLSTSAGARTLRVLAKPDAVVNLAGVEQAFDLTLMPPDLGANENLSQQELEDLIADATESSFAVTGRAGSPDFEVEVFVKGLLLGRLLVTVTSSAGAEIVKLGVPKPKIAKGATIDPQFERIIKTLRKGLGINIHYDSGHAIADRRVFPTEFRRVPFDKFRGAKFPATDIEKEKPANLAMIGTGDSLFCWLQRTARRGHLMCDDGSMEKADFIHIDDGPNPTVTFFHIKGSHSGKDTREISVSAYEVVSAQAKKNLIWLDKKSLIAGLSERVRPANQYWLNRAPSSQAAFLTAVNQLRTDSPRKVVIIQPSLSLKTRKTYAGGGNANALRLDQLDFLLASAENDCRSLSAEFEVICAK